LIRLILFDIDGTLLDAGDLSRRCFLRVVRRFANPEAALDQGSLSGKTDPQIMTEFLLQNGLPPGQTDRTVSEALKSYQSCYLSNLKEADVRPLDGARELIERLEASRSARLLLGILSGNMEGLIVPKLEAAGIPASSFVVGAFGSDDADRDRLPAIAVERAEESFRTHILPNEVAIVGDTPFDIMCARRFGAVSIAVATGDYTYEQLEATSPTHLLPSLLAWSEVEQEIGLDTIWTRPMDESHPSGSGPPML
jgi:phosphoglycolate phosphatase-like HAD superfamily hydrolase